MDDSLLNSRQGLTSAKWSYLPWLWLSPEWGSLLPFIFRKATSSPPVAQPTQEWDCPVHNW